MADLNRYPTISVMVTTYNYGRFLGEAIESLLAQTYPSVEVVVVDDGSTDNTSEVARAYGDRIHYHYQNNQGIAAGRNTGLSLATSDYYSFLDADDFWVTNKLSLQMQTLQNDPTIDIVYGHAHQFLSPEVSDEFRSSKGYRKEIIPAPLASSMLIRRSTFESVGKYINLPVAVDQDWYMRAVELGLNMCMLEDVLFFRRIHENNNGVRVSESDKKRRLHVIKAALDRRRKNSIK